jgi:hypothetical protein
MQKGIRLSFSMKHPRMPEDINDETFRSIQQRLHMDKVAQADADGSRNAVEEFHVHRRNLEAKNKTLRTESFALQSEIRALKKKLDRMRTHMKVGEAATYASLTTEINSLKQTLEKERDDTEKLAKVTKDKFATRAREVTSLIAKMKAFSSQVDTLTTEKHTLVAEKAEEVPQARQIDCRNSGSRTDSGEKTQAGKRSSKSSKRQTHYKHYTHLTRHQFARRKGGLDQSSQHSRDREERLDRRKYRS